MKIFNGMNWANGLLIGIGVALVAPVVLPALGGMLRTMAKSAIKGGLILSEKGKAMVAEAKESMGDLAAEAKAEIAQKQ